MCCGQMTYHPKRPSGLHPDLGARRTFTRRPSAAAAARYEYVGPTALTVRGPISGKVYRFEATGATLRPDPRDRAALARVPGLRPVR